MELPQKSLTIGQLASASSVGVQTLRFYEREGLLPQPPRSRSGYRQYPPETSGRVQFIKRAKELGFTLKETGELLKLRVDPGKSCADVRTFAQEKIADVERRLTDLTRIKNALNKLSLACQGSGPTSECPILDALGNGST